LYTRRSVAVVVVLEWGLSVDVMKMKKDVGVPCTARPSIALVVLKCRYNEKKMQPHLVPCTWHAHPSCWFIMLGTVRRVCTLVVVVLEQGWSVDITKIIEMRVYFVHPLFRCCSGMGVVMWK